MRSQCSQIGVPTEIWSEALEVATAGARSIRTAGTSTRYLWRYAAEPLTLDAIRRACGIGA